MSKVSHFALIVTMVSLMPLHGQDQLATTEDGRRVRLKDDGTWEYVQQQPEDVVIAEFSGNGTANTRPFTAEGPWEIRWNARGDLFQVFVYTASGSMEGITANQLGSGTGSSYQPRGGKYYLQVNAIGSWAIAVVSVSP